MRQQNIAPGQLTGKSFTLPARTLALIEAFTVWQMGVVYYSTRTFTVNGVTPLPVSVDTVAVPVALGYLIGAALSYFAPRRVGLWAKIITLLSLTVTLLMYAPMRGEALAGLFYTETLLCVALISAMGTLAINLYSLKTALKDGIIATLIPSPVIAVLHLHTSAPSFRAFNLVCAVIQLMMLLGLMRIPNKVEMNFLPSRRGQPQAQQDPAPKMLIFATAFVYTLVCLCCLFSSTAAESIKGGISVYYFAGTVWTAVFAVLHYAFKRNPFRLFAVFLGVGAFGFVLWLFPLAGLRPVSLALQGAALGLCNLAWFTMGVLFERHSSRSIAPAAILIAFAAAMLNSGLMELLREKTETLYAIYAVVALALLIVYYMAEPCFRQVWDSFGQAEPEKCEEPQEQFEIADLPLTKREKEVLPLVLQGCGNAEIAEKLFISEHTVKTHVKNIYQKLDVHSRFELAAKIKTEIK